jgi:Cdc6-like AAA superfamily ATPase
LETNPLPEIEGTAEEKLSASLAALKMTDQAESNCFYRSGTHFASNLKTILKFLCASIESKGAHGGDQGEPAALYVCGVPGIGKTSGVKWCCTKAIEEATSNSGYEGPTPTVVHINAGHLSSAPKPQGILLEELARALGMKKPKKSYLLKRIKSKEMILVVVDEIDLLVSKSNSQVVEGRLGGTEGVIQTLLDFAEDESMPIALIGISNSSGNDKYHRLNEIGKVRSAVGQLLRQSTTPSTHFSIFPLFLLQFKDTVTFKSYSKDDLVGIVQARIGNKIVDPKALEFMAMKVESSTGDARSVLEMTAKAIERRLSAVRDGSRLPSNPNAPLVTMADVMPAVKKSNTKIADTIEGLPTMGKASLCVLATLARVGAKPTTLGKLKRFVTEAMSENQHEELLTLDDFKALVETLVDTGLLTIGGSMKANLGMGNLLTMPISLGLQLEDVQVAITNGLGKERFYENLCEFTKKNTNLL